MLPCVFVTGGHRRPGAWWSGQRTEHPELTAENVGAGQLPAETDLRLEGFCSYRADPSWLVLAAFTVHVQVAVLFQSYCACGLP